MPIGSLLLDAGRYLNSSIHMPYVMYHLVPHQFSSVQPPVLGFTYNKSINKSRFLHVLIFLFARLKSKNKSTIYLELRGIEPRTFHMRSEHSTSELQPHNNMTATCDK